MFFVDNFISAGGIAGGWTGQCLVPKVKGAKTMNTKNTIVSGLAAAVAGLSLMACSSLTGTGSGGSPGGGVSNELTTTFKCVQADRGWAAIAERGNAVSKTPPVYLE